MEKIEFIEIKEEINKLRGKNEKIKLFKNNSFLTDDKHTKNY